MLISMCVIKRATDKALVYPGKILHNLLLLFLRNSLL